MESKKKVFIIGPAHPLRGGLATFNQRFAEEFLNQGYDAEIYNYKLQYPGIFFPGKSQYTDEPAPERVIIRTIINSVNPFNWIKVGRQIRKERPDIIVFRYWMPFFAPCIGTIARIVRMNRLTRILAIADNVIPHEKRPGDSLLTKYFVSSMHGFITMSEAVKEQLKTFTSKKPILYNPHPLYDNFGEPLEKIDAKLELGLNTDTDYILFFGFIRAYKGLDILLEAFSSQRLNEKNIKLLVVGEFYDDEEKYYRIVREKNLSDRVVFVKDFVPDSRVKYYFSASEIVAQPYKDATQSGVTQIAYHFNKPMVVTNVGALPEMVPDGKVGFVTDVSAEAVADALLKYFDNPDKDDFITHIKEEKRKYSWGNFIKKIIAEC
jgi:glycosyltransferase involved in cell wall biosynthesis